MTVQELINKLSFIQDKDKPCYCTSFGEIEDIVLDEDEDFHIKQRILRKMKLDTVGCEITTVVECMRGPKIEDNVGIVWLE